MFNSGENKRFRVIYKQGTMSHCRIIVDTETGVNYLFVDNGGYAGGITVLLDREGRPVISPLEH